MCFIICWHHRLHIQFGKIAIFLIATILLLSIPLFPSPCIISIILDQHRHLFRIWTLASDQLDSINWDILPKTSTSFSFYNAALFDELSLFSCLNVYILPLDRIILLVPIQNSIWSEAKTDFFISVVWTSTSESFGARFYFLLQKSIFDDSANVGY